MWWILGYHLLASQEDLHAALYCYQVVPGCLLPKLRGYYHAAKYIFLVIMPQGTVREDVVNGGLFVAIDSWDLFLVFSVLG